MIFADSILKSDRFAKLMSDRLGCPFCQRADGHVDLWPIVDSVQIDFEKWVQSGMGRQCIARLPAGACTVEPDGQLLWASPEILVSYLGSCVPGFADWFDGLLKGICLAVPPSEVEKTEQALARQMGDDAAADFMGLR